MPDGINGREMRFELALANGDLQAARDQVMRGSNFDDRFQRYAKVLARGRGRRSTHRCWS